MLYVKYDMTKKFTLGICACACIGVLTAFAGPKAVVERQKPFNLFEPNRAIEFNVKGQPGEIVVTDYDGRKVPFEFSNGKLKIGGLGPGYYEIRHAGGMNSFGVAPFMHRTAAEALKEGSRFGLKVFLIGKPGVWWRRPLTWEVDECVTACERLGLQWTRHGFNIKPNPEERGVIGTEDLVKKHEMNCVMKVEGIPEEAYDEKRYGPKENFAKTKNKRGWVRCSVPLKEPYQKWLRSELAKLPPSTPVFEMGNEVWDYMKADEFAQWCNIAVPVIREMFPKAAIGADPGNLKWGTEFAKAGGFDGMNAMFIHPYSFTPMPEVRIRAWLRNRREYFEKAVGHRLDVYVTEYGWPTAPKDKRKHSVDERRQAQRTTRESLMLYAEDCKTLIPHWMADREQDPTEREHWFGFFRLCGEPRPVVMAHAACARMIDGSRFAGDLVVPGAETGVGAMLFVRKDSWVVAFWTQDEAPGTGRDITLPAVDAQRFGIMGEKIPLEKKGRTIKLHVDGNVTYLVGNGNVPAALAKLVDRSDELSETRWLERTDGGAAAYTVAKGKAHAMPLRVIGDATATPCEAGVWTDDKFLHFNLKVPAANLVKDAGQAYFRFSTRPDRQLELNGYDLYDFELRVSYKEGTTSVVFSNSMFNNDIVPKDGIDESGIRRGAEMRNGAYSFEIAIPKRLLNGFGTNAKSLMAGQVAWVSGGKKWFSETRVSQKNYQWPLWKLAK